MTRIRYQEAAGLEVKRGRPPLGPGYKIPNRLTGEHSLFRLINREGGH